jgi:hypothetical protein
MVSRMSVRGSRALGCACIFVLALGVSACGGGGGSASTSALDKASGLTVTVAGDRVTLKRSATSTAGAGITAGEVVCTDDYRKLVKATATPAPTLPWYAATLITWPAANKASTATLSHALNSAPQLCVAEPAGGTDVVVYFTNKTKTGVAKLEADDARHSQASRAPAALQSAAQAAVATVTGGSFPVAAAVVQAIAAQGFYVKQAAALSDISQTGTMYVITNQTTTKQLVIALKDTKGAIQIAMQGVTGSPKLSTAKP